MTPENTSRPGDTGAARSRFAGDIPTVPDVAAILAEVDRDTDAWWKSCALAGIQHLAALGTPFTCYDVARLGVPEPDHPARWGGLFSAARAAGLIVPVGIVGSSRPSVHRALVRQWVGSGGDPR